MKIDTFTGGYFQTNGYLLTHNGAAWLIDAPDGIADWLATREIVPEALLLTHLHYDHIIDAAVVKERFDCPIWSHSQPDPDLTLETVLKESIGWPFNVTPFESDHLMAGKTEVEIGGLNFDLYHVPGHSPDSLCFAPRISSSEAADGPPVLFGGDVLFQGSIGRTDFPHGNHDQLLEGILSKLYPLPGETVVYPGHGPATTVGVERIQNPYVRA
ncbi:MAG: MBL fold metallo-hydrolase [Verrucomicrobiae bacterium]|nr:MBL fold metallo-hydrolase [Verrucomicrobiae bacterium]